ncbi:unnamed protein product [Cuscuta campestris]|uniref:S-adenosylmethionine decarboxylase proenzyme n=1 Tax=Cuscuta campestris TaxID=132261 RepID=A0A484M9H1_9ASTE|nr:unnamed protein product [Cuscuta campestris]
MAASGFEGFEKRLELHFSVDDPVAATGGLRRLSFEALGEVLCAVQCTVVAAVGNQYFDSYVLSESSLFVYPTKIIIKTCGTTQLLKSVRPMTYFAARVGLTLSQCRYTRGNFIFPKAQPYPHTSFNDEVMYLEDELPSHLCYRKASILPSTSTAHSWHVFCATNDWTSMGMEQSDSSNVVLVEVCMTELDRALACKFFARADTLGKDMTNASGIRHINPNAVVCDFAFHPCGYSMNGIENDRYSTIHVTPEDGFSYASFECVWDPRDGDIARVLEKAARVFRPGVMSVAITCNGGNNEAWNAVAKAVEGGLGMKCRSCVADEFPAAGKVTFQTYVARRK